MNRKIYYHFAVLAILFSSCALRAEKIASFEATSQLPDLRWTVDNLLHRLNGTSYRYGDKTQGFSYLFEDRADSPFDFRLYLGTVSLKNKAGLIRIEGSTGDVDVLTRILQIEKIIIKPDVEAENGVTPLPLEPKSHLAAQGLNLIAPWLSVLYTSSNSPKISTGQTVFRFLSYFFADLFFVWAGGRNYFLKYTTNRDQFESLTNTSQDRTTRWNPHQNAGKIAAGLVLMRIIGAVQENYAIRGHNKLVELKYTFYLD